MRDEILIKKRNLNIDDDFVYIKDYILKNNVKKFVNLLYNVDMI